MTNQLTNGKLIDWQADEQTYGWTDRLTKQPTIELKKKKKKKKFINLFQLQVPQSNVHL